MRGRGSCLKDYPPSDVMHAKVRELLANRDLAGAARAADELTGAQPHSAEAWFASAGKSISGTMCAFIWMKWPAWVPWWSSRRCSRRKMRKIWLRNG